MNYTASSAKSKHRLLLIITPIVIFSLAVMSCSSSAKPGQYLLNYPPPDKDTVAYRQLAMAVDSIAVIKHSRAMYVFNHRQLLKVYKISLGTCPIGAKHFQGDRKTPEGMYHINGKNPNSMAHKSLGISYPNDGDRVYARNKGIPTGGDIKIHGVLNGNKYSKEDYVGVDWTWGCIAVSDDEIDELYQHVIVGVPINILP